MARAFHFRLETVLRVRTLRQREAQRKVGAKVAEIAGLNRLIAETAAEIGSRQSQLAIRQGSTRVDPRELAAERAWVNYLRRGQAERLERKAGVSRELDTLLADSRQARMQMLMLEKLRERRQAEWRRETQHREQTDADELARQLLSRSAGSGALQ